MLDASLPISLRIPESRAPDASVAGMLAAMTALFEAINCAMQGEPANARQHVDRACSTLAADPVVAENFLFPGTEIPGASIVRGGLAPWQIRVLTAHIEAHLEQSIHGEDLAQLARLSLSHFMRAFRDSFGCPPHTFLIKRRMHRAQGLMLTTSAPLNQIALECGFSDQSHLSRLFSRLIGETPAAWRRARVCYTAGEPTGRFHARGG